MEIIGQGAQYEVTTDGVRVFKTLKTLDESMAMYRKWGYHLRGRDVKDIATKTLQHAKDSVSSIRKILEAYPQLGASLANPTIDDNLNYSQDKVTVLGRALRSSSRTEAKELIDQYVDLQLQFASYGFADCNLQVGVNYGVDKNGRVALIDLGELNFNKEEAVKAAAAKKWRKAETYWAPTPLFLGEALPWSLKFYYRKQLLTRLTPDALSSNWLAEEK